MKKFYLIIILLIFSTLIVFGQNKDQEEIDYLLFLPNRGNAFVDENMARIQLDNIASHLKGLDLVPGQIIVYGYTAFSMVDIDAQDLSRERAAFITSELQKRGIPRNLFATPVGHGSVDLWGSNLSEEDKMPNRRVRILVDGKIVAPPVVIIEPEPKPEPVPEIKVIPEPEPERAPVIVATEGPKPEVIKKEPYSKFPWIVLLPILLIPLFFIYKKMKDKETEEKPDVKNEPVPEEKQIAPAPVPKQESAPAPIVEKKPVKEVENIVDLEEEIRTRAYFRSQGHTEYSDVDQDWFVEMPKVRAEYEAKGYVTYIENGTWWAKKTFVQK